MEYLPTAFYALKSYAQFIIYQISPSKTRPGKTDKYPISTSTMRPSNAHDAALWMTADEAIATAAVLGNGYGVGFVFTPDDPFWFLDIDNCLVNSQWSPLACELLGRLAGAAVEVSLSNQGLHIIGSGVVHAHACKNVELGIELYTSGRFVALTGTHALGDAGLLATTQINAVAHEYFPTTAAPGNTGDIMSRWEVAVAAGASRDYTATIDDDELIRRMLASRSGKNVFAGGASIHDLWEGNAAVLAVAYPDDGGREYDSSSADAALAQRLAFWTGKDPERMERLMRMSGLKRDKYDRPDYLSRTILQACDKQTSIYTEKHNNEPVTTMQAAGAVAGAGASAAVAAAPARQYGAFLTAHDQAEHFKGCVYVADEEKVMVPRGIMYKPSVFKTMYGGHSFVVDQANGKVTRNAFEAFAESSVFATPKVDTTCFSPREEPGKTTCTDGETAVNIYWPVPTACTEGDVTPFLTHVRKLLPNEDDALKLLYYMAAIVQYPGVKFQWCPFIQGVEGNGKTLFSRCIVESVGDRYSHFPKAAELDSKFNDFLYAKIFIAVEDIYVSEGKQQVYEALKPMVTADRLEIEPKGGKKVTRKVCANFIINSNHKDGLRKTKNNRTFAPFYTAQQCVDDLTRDGLTGAYFSGLYGWLDRGGYANVHYYLRHLEIPDDMNPATYCKRAPTTSSTVLAVSQSAGRVEQEIREAIESGDAGFRNEWISSTALHNLLVDHRATGICPRSKRKDLLAEMGYHPHPVLKDGRASRAVMPDGKQSHLYVRHDHKSLFLESAAEVCAAYEDDQRDRH